MKEIPKELTILNNYKSTIFIVTKHFKGTDIVDTRVTRNRYSIRPVLL